MLTISVLSKHANHYTAKEACQPLHHQTS